MTTERQAKSSVWWLYLILGILATLLGFALFGNMAFTFTVVEVLVGTYFLVSGIGGAVITIVDRKSISLWGLKLALEILVIVAGIFMLTRPAFALSFIWFICGFGFLFNGIALIVQSVNMKKFIEGSSWVAVLILGILVILAGFSIMSNPLIGLWIVNFCVAFGVLFFGISTIVYSVKIKN